MKAIAPQIIPTVEKVLPGLVGLGAEKTGADVVWFAPVKDDPQLEQNPVPSGLFVPQLVQNTNVSFLSQNACAVLSVNTFSRTLYQIDLPSNQ